MKAILTTRECPWWPKLCESTLQTFTPPNLLGVIPYCTLYALSVIGFCCLSALFVSALRGGCLQHRLPVLLPGELLLDDVPHRGEASSR